MFKNTSIKIKLFLPISILIFIFIVLTTSIIYTHYSKTSSLIALKNRVILATYISKTLHEIQKERGMTSGFLADHNKKFQEDLFDQRELSDKRLNELKKFLTIKDNNIKTALLKTIQELPKLYQVRDNVNVFSITSDEAIAFYSALNEKFLHIIIEISKTSKLPNTTQNIIAYSDFLHVKENLGRIRAIGVAILSQDTTTNKIPIEFESLISIQKQYLKQFLQYASNDAKLFLANTFQNRSYMDEIQKTRALILNSESTKKTRTDPKQWFKHITLKIDKLKFVDDYLEKEIISNIEKELVSTYKYFGLFAFLNLLGIILFIVMIMTLLNLLEDEKRLKSIVDKYIISSTTNLKGIITFASEGFCRTSGYSKEELIGKPHSIVRHPDMLQSTFQNMWDVIQKGQPWNGRIKNRTKDGAYYWVYAYVEPLFNTKGHIEGYMAVRLNITESINLEDKIKEEVEKSRIKDRTILQQSRLAQMGEMISMIAHQWRQPLAAISATSASLELKASLNRLDNDMVQQKAQNISGFSQHLSHTIDDFRNFFKPDKSKEEITFAKIIESSLKIVQTELESKNILVQTEYKCKGTVLVYANELRQVALNLIKNAEDALLEKEIKEPKIIIRCYSDKDKSVLEVLDNAGGIDDTIINNIFDPYFSTKTNKDGTGLGLYMSKTIIEDHCDGEISVGNTVEGALFKITLNKQKDEDENN